MKIIQNAIIKELLTEKSKLRIKNKYKNEIFQLRKETEQLIFEYKRLERSAKYSRDSLKIKFDKEMANRERKINNIQYELEQLKKLPLGSEIKIMELEVVEKIQVGSRIDELINDKIIIVEDGVIVEIR